MGVMQLSLEWPVIVTRVGGQPTMEEFDAYLDSIDNQVLAAQRPHGYLIVVDEGRGYGREGRQRHVKWQAERRDVLNQYSVGTAMVMPQISMFMRFALSTLLALMGDSAQETKLFDNELEARSWIESRISKRAA